MDENLSKTGSQTLSADSEASLEDLEERKEQFANYTEYNKTVRTWFVTFGVGAPILFVTQPDLMATLRLAGVLEVVVPAFLAGCGLQVLLAVTNKITSWMVYSSSFVPDSKQTCAMKAAIWMTSAFWIDAFIDVATLALFGFASVRVMFSILN